MRATIVIISILINFVLNSCSNETSNSDTVSNLNNYSNNNSINNSNENSSSNSTNNLNDNFENSSINSAVNNSTNITNSNFLDNSINLGNGNNRSTTIEDSYIFFSFSKAMVADDIEQQQRGYDAVTMVENSITGLNLFELIILKEHVITLGEYQENPVDFIVSGDIIREKYLYLTEEKLLDNDTIIIYSHTHGRKANEEYDIPLGGLVLDVRGNTLPNMGTFLWSEYAQLILDLPAKNVVILTMSCYSGGLINYLNTPEIKEKWENRQQNGRNFLVITSQNVDLPSNPARINGELLNPFTYSVTKALKGEADGYNNAEKDQKITFTELIDYILDTTKSIGQNNNADPQMTGSYDPDFALYSLLE